MNFFCIADEDTVRGFRLAGVPGQAVSAPAQAAAALSAAASRGDCGIVILTEPVAAEIREAVDAFRLERACPLVVEIPGPVGPAGARRSLRAVAQEALGIRIDEASP
jgi:vacuolar-type H+-ATPase subunit F/Vma7